MSTTSKLVIDIETIGEDFEALDADVQQMVADGDIDIDDATDLL